MKVKKYYIGYIIIFISLFITYILCIKFDAIYILIIWFLLIYLLVYLEMKHISNNLNKYFKDKNYEDGINYIKNKSDNNIFVSSKNYCLMYLTLLYMFNDQSNEAKKLLVNEKVLSRYKELYFTQFILAIAEEDNEHISFYYNKIINLKNKIFNIQIDSAKKIIEMLNTNVMNQEIHDNTNYPLLKRICKKINGEEVVIESLKVEKKEKVVFTDCSGIKKILKISLNIITCLTLLIGMFIGVFVVSIVNDKNSLPNEVSVNLTNYTWILWLFLPISISNILYAFYLKKQNYKFKSNLIIGIIFTVLLFIYGSFFLIVPFAG